MDLGIRGQVALVTAGSRGLGRAVALELAREGARVALAGRDPKVAEQSAKEIAAETGSEVVGWRCDVSRGKEVRELVNRVADRFQRVDLLVCNAGGPPGGDL